MGLNSMLSTAIERLARFRNVPQAAPADPNGYRIVYMPVSTTGLHVTQNNILAIPAVWACISVITKAIASCEWQVIETAPGSTRREIRVDHPLHRLLNSSPNLEMTAFDFREAILTNALAQGNGYAEIERDGFGNPVGLWPIPSIDTEFVRDDDNALYLRVHGQQGRADIAYSNVYHVHGLSFDGLEGLYPYSYGRETFGKALAMDQFDGAFFRNNMQLGGILSTEQSLQKEQVDDLRAQLEARHGGAKNAGKFLILHGGLNYEKLSSTHAEAQSGDQRNAVIEDICRIFGVPPHKIAHLVRSTFNNIEHQGLEFVRDALTPWATRLAQEAEKKLSPSAMITTRIDLDWLAEGDAKAKAESDAISVDHGLETRNEVRARRRRNQLANADDLTVQQQMIPTDLMGDHIETEPAEEPENEETVRVVGI